MRKYLLLTKVLIKCGMGNQTAARRTKTRMQQLLQILLYLFIAVCLLPFEWLLFIMMRTVAGGLEPLGLGYFTYDIVCLLLSLSTLIIALPFVMSVMFLTKDMEYLLPMPFSSWQIAGAKFTTVLLYEYLTTALLGIPMFAGIGAAAHQGPFYIVNVLLTLLGLPVLPVIYGCFLGVLLLPLTNRLRNKEAITTIFSVLIVFVSAGFGMFGSFIGNHIESIDIIQIITGNRRLFINTEYLFPNMRLAVNGLEQQNPLWLLLYVASSAAVIILFLFIGNRFYLKAVAGMGEISQKREKMTAAEETRSLKSSGIVRSFAVKEWKLLVRTPVYFLNCVLSVFIMPLILAGAIIVSFLGNMSELTAGFKQLSAFVHTFPAEHLAGILTLIIFALSALLSSMNMTAATCISREGTGIFEMKCIPVPYQKQLLGKMLCALCISFAATLPYTIFLSLAGAALLGTPVWLLLPALAVNIFVVIAIGFLQLLGDLWKPKLSWSSEQAAVKQNVVAMLTTLAALVLCLLIGAGCIALYLLHFQVYAILAAGIVVLGAAAAALWRSVLRYGERAITRLE